MSNQITKGDIVRDATGRQGEGVRTSGLGTITVKFAEFTSYYRKGELKVIIRAKARPASPEATE